MGFSSESITLEDGTNHLKTPEGRDCLFLWEEEDDSLEIEIPADHPESVQELDIGRGRDRDCAASGADLPVFFVLEQSVVSKNRTGSRVEELSVFCHDEKHARAFLECTGLLNAIESLFSNYELYSFSTTETGHFSLLWLDWRPKKLNSSRFISEVLNQLDIIAKSTSNSPVRAQVHDSIAEHKEKKKKTRQSHTLFQTDGKTLFWWLSVLSLSSGYFSLSTGTIELTKWLGDHLYLPLSLIFAIYFLLSQVRHYSVWKELREQKKNQGLVGRYAWAGMVSFIWTVVASIFFGFPLMALFSFPVAMLNSTFGEQTLISQSARILEKKSEENGGISFDLVNPGNEKWNFQVSNGEFSTYKVGDTYPIRLYRGSLGISYARVLDERTIE